MRPAMTTGGTLIAMCAAWRLRLQPTVLADSSDRAPTATKTLPSNAAGLVRALHEGRLVVSVGAGFSVPAGLPGWRGLLQGIFQDCQCGQNKDFLALASSLGVSDQLQFAVVASAGKTCACEAMQRRLCGKPETPEMTRRLDALSALPLAALITWNWDDLLERRFEVVRHSWQQGFGDAVLSSRGGDVGACPLLLMQGDPSQAASCVVTEQDYRHRQAVRGEFLRRLYCESGHVVLHIGTHVDKFVAGQSQGVIGPILSGTKPVSQHYALVNDPTEEECTEALKFGVTLIPYDSAGHTRHTEELCWFLDSLRDASP